MTDPVLALVLIISLAGAAMTVRFFRTLEDDFWSAARNPILAGVLAGVVIRTTTFDIRLQTVAMGLVMTLAALYSRLTGDESEPADGMLLGAVSGAAAAIPLVVLSGNEPLPAFSQPVLAGAVAGFGITWAVLHVADKLRQVIWDVVTAAAAIVAAAVPAILARLGAEDRHVAIGAAAVGPLLVMAAMFRQWPQVRAELQHEASLGFIDPADVGRTAHPILRLGRAGWSDRGAHREFVRLAYLIALRKRQLRGRPDETARLYQLEIMKLRMQLQRMTRIEHASARARREGEGPSDTMRLSE
ncbi:MAG TPA: hypothetical protein VM779_08615 [Thermoanaerobaculia bacterium]|nr:hypothetical protein [Thermoanaerobaculia bacterium]